MGRGRAKAKQTRVARDLKYRSVETDFASLERELRGQSIVDEIVDEVEEVPDQYADIAGEYIDDADELLSGDEHERRA